MKLTASMQSVITGAGGGFGRALALALARKGGRLVVSDVNLAGAEETAALARAQGASAAKAVACDVRKLEDVERLAAACEGEIDLVVNNAGVSTGGLIGDIPIDDWRWTLDVDLWGVIYGCHVFVPRLKKQGRGHVLNVASAAGFAFAPGMGPYNVAKAGVIALSETLAAELSDTAIGVTVLCPTFFKTNIAASGRFNDPKVRAEAERLVANGKDADAIARDTLKAVERGALYCVPMADARFVWRLNRAMPGAVGKLVARAQRKAAR